MHFPWFWHPFFNTFSASILPWIFVMILHGIGDARAASLSQNGALQRPRATRITKKSSGGATLTAKFVHCLAKQSPWGTPGTPRPTPGCYFGDFSMIIASIFHGFLDRFRLHFLLFFIALHVHCRTQLRYLVIDPIDICCILPVIFLRNKWAS